MTDMVQDQEVQAEEIQNEAPPPAETQEEEVVVAPSKVRFNESAQREAARLRAEADKMMEGVGDEPTLEGMDHDVEKFTRAQVDQSHRKIAAELLRKSAEAKDAEAANSIRQSWESMAEEARKTYKDFDAVFDGNTKITRTMAEALVSLDAPGDVAYYLGRNKAEAERISNLPSHLQGLEIARIERAVIARKNKPTQAPEPAKQHVSGVRGAKEESFREYSERRRKELEAR